MNETFCEDFIKKIPKTDLHVHLDGSIRPTTLAELAKKRDLLFPSYDPDELNKILFKERYSNLEEYLSTFYYTGLVMQDPVNIERIAYELAVDNQNEGVRYIEVRFAPQLHITKEIGMEIVLEAVNSGLKRAKIEFNDKPEIKNGNEPPFSYGIIVCAMRKFGSWSPYYEELIRSLSFSSKDYIFKIASLELAKGAVQIRDKTGMPIVGFDLAGEEHGHPASYHKNAFIYAHQAFMAKTVHAGEDYGPESIFQAITELNADRIGHGYFLFDTSKIEDPMIKERQKYIDNLVRYIAVRRIPIEVCLTSNLQTICTICEIKDHTFGKMLENGICVTFCTDNRTVSKTTVTNEILTAIKNFPISPKILKDTIIYGFKRSFYHGSYPDKRAYVRQCINYYDKLAETFLCAKKRS